MTGRLKVEVRRMVKNLNNLENGRILGTGLGGMVTPELWVVRVQRIDAI